MNRLQIARTILETYIGGDWTDDEVLDELARNPEERGDTLLTFMLNECCEEDLDAVEAQDRIFGAAQTLGRVYDSLSLLI